MLVSLSKRHPVVCMINITDLAICFSGSELLQMSQNNVEKNPSLKDAGRGKCAILASLL